MCNEAHQGECNLANLTPDQVKSVIVRKEKLSPVLTLFEIKAPLIAASAKAGQFVMVCPGEFSERLPLTISDYDAEKGTITLIFQEVGRGTIELGRFEPGSVTKPFRPYEPSSVVTIS